MSKTQIAYMLEALPEPAMLVDRGGAVVRSNRAMKRLMGADVDQHPLSDYIEDDANHLNIYLDRCMGSSDPMIGSIHLRAPGSTAKMQCKGSAVRLEDEPLVLLRFLASQEQQFKVLTETVDQLRNELKRRRRSEAMLEEALRERELLIRELEHRVKNNMQMLSALLSGAEREASSSEAKAALRDASLRFSAVSAVQQLLYRSDDLESIRSDALVSTIIEAVTRLTSEPPQTQINVDALDLPIQSAVQIGLILNELLTNAVKYGRPDAGTQRILVEFISQADRICIAVQDNGAGFDPTESRKRASGIGLVRGLLRQLGGSFAVENVGGSRCIASFPAPKPNFMKSAH